MSGSGHKYWRVNVTACAYGSYPCIAEVTMATSAGGTDAIRADPYVTALSSASPYFPPADAVDGDLTTYWNGGSGATGWLGFEFSAPQNIVEVKMIARADTPSTSPSTWTLDYSDDGAAWTTAQAFTSQTWGSTTLNGATVGTEQVFDVGTGTGTVVSTVNPGPISQPSSAPSTTPPTIVQSAYGGEQNTSPVTVTLGAAPTAGNVLVMVVLGYDDGYRGPPTGFTTLWEGTSGHPVEYQYTAMFYRYVQAGDPTAYSIAATYKWINLLELSGFQLTGTSARAYAGVISGNTASTPSLSSAAATTLRLIGMETDNAGAAPSSVPSGWTQVSPSGWQATSGYHAASLWSVPANTAGIQTVTCAGAPQYPVFFDVQLSGSGAPAPSGPTTLNPSDCGPGGITFSNGNLTVQAVSSSTGAGARATNGGYAGKLYFEAYPASTNQVSNGTRTGIAITQPGDNFASYTESYPVYGFEMLQQGAYFYNGNSAFSGANSLGQAPVWCCAVDFGAKLAWIRGGTAGAWNGSPSADPGSGVGGLDISALTPAQGLFPLVFMSPSTTDEVTANFGASPFVATMPEGFSSWNGGAPATGPTTGSASTVQMMVCT
jgi:hypothetical protein